MVHCVQTTADKFIDTITLMTV